MPTTIFYSLVNRSYCVLGFLNQFHWQDVTNLEPRTYEFPFETAQYADMALIFVESDFFTVFYPGSCVCKVVRQMSFYYFPLQQQMAEQWNLQCSPFNVKCVWIQSCLAPCRANILFVIFKEKKSAKLFTRSCEWTGNLLGVWANKATATLCQCWPCLCNAGLNSIMSKLISCKRKLNRTCLKREENMVDIAF